jgi:glucose-1-phosphate thymidylyltransferase
VIEQEVYKRAIRCLLGGNILLHGVEKHIVSGWWKDVGTYEGLLEALYMLLDDVDERVEGEVYGPAYIGRNTYIGRNAVVEHFVSVEQESKILSGSLTRSLVLDGVFIDVNSLRLRDNVIGSKSVVKTRSNLYGEARFIISDYSVVEL